MIDTEIEQQIVRALYEQNAWWVNGTVPKELAKPFKRRDFHILKNKLSEKEITAIIGPRQVGKTTTLYQLIDFLIHNQKIDSKRILYVSFDYPYLTMITKTPINDILGVYATQVMHEPIRILTAPIYVFLDEVCKLENWSQLLKGWYDLNRQIKFVISHSSSAEVLKGSSESLVGRISPFIMFPLKFIDMLLYFEKEIDVNSINWDLRNGFSESIKDQNPESFFAILKNAYSRLVPFEETIKVHLQRYLLKDGYPGLLEEYSLAVCREKLRNYLDLTIYKDLVRIFNVRDPKALEELITLIADNTSQRFDYSSLSNTLSLKSDTVVKYLNFLESVFLISRAEFYSKSRAARIRKNKKIYLSNVGLRNSLIGAMDESLLRNTAELGKVVETLVYEHCKRLRFRLEPGIDPKLYYWKTRQGDEVDIVMEVFRQPIPIEVKYKNEVSLAELRGLNKFATKLTTSFGIVVTKDYLDIKSKILFIPLWLFLLMC